MQILFNRKRTVYVYMRVEHKEVKTRNLLISTNYIAQREKYLVGCFQTNYKYDKKCELKLYDEDI